MTTPQKPRRRPQQKPATAYHWFQGASVRTLYDRLADAGPDTARIEVRLDGEKMTFRVVGDAESLQIVGEDIDDSRRCPPICP